MGYRAAAEQLHPGEAPLAFLPWAFMAEDAKQRHLTEPGPCADCGMDDLPRVKGWQLCTYCSELRALRRRLNTAPRTACPVWIDWHG